MATPAEVRERLGATIVVIMVWTFLLPMSIVAPNQVWGLIAFEKAILVGLLLLFVVLCIDYVVALIKEGK